MKTRLERSIEYIMGYCNKHDKCEECPLYGKEGCTLTIEYYPCDWKAKEMITKRRKRINE